jgi:ribosomal protein S18 acetylase RimI-like enzyme
VIVKSWRESREDELTAPTVRKQIRPAVESDVAALVLEDADLEGLYRDRVERQEREQGRLLIFREQEQEPPVGIVYLWLEDAEEEEVRTRLPGVPLIMHLKVHESRQRRGIGTALMEEAERIAAKAGKTRIALGVDPDNENAIRLYRRLGYREWDHGLVETHRVEFHEDGECRYDEKCLIFVKPLSTASPRDELQSLAEAHGIPG